ncbi:major facilitator superfamily transporter [Haematococcus lacustris]
MLLCNAHRSAFSLLVPQVAAHFELAASDVGMLQSAMLVGYLVGQLPAGRLSDSLGGERVMIGSLLLWSISLVASGTVTSLPSLLLTRAAMGLFSACAMPGVSAMAAAWVPQASRSGVVAAIYAVFNLGGVVGMLVVPWLALAAGWRGALAWAGAAVRQAMHVVSTLGCALSMLPLALRGGSGSLGPAEATAWLVVYNACYGFSFGGFHPYIQDVAGGSAGLLTGLTNSCSIAMGIMGNLCTGALVQMTGTFSTVFVVTMALYLSSCCVFLAVLKLQPIQL